MRARASRAGLAALFRETEREARAMPGARRYREMWVYTVTEAVHPVAGGQLDPRRAD